MPHFEGARVLVTGATGFVAHHVIQLLQKEGYRVRCTVRNIKNEGRLKSLRNLCPDAKYTLEITEADLTADDGWTEAVEDCTYCIHVASPLPNAPPRNEDDLMVPAVEGTKRVLRVCEESGSIKRVVLTSSIFAVHGETEGDENHVYTEDDWTDLSSSNLGAYEKSKTMAERAAWAYMESLPSKSKMELSVVNPSFIFGPCVNGVACSSLQVLKRMMDWSTPALTSLYFPFCDARDVALAHLRAMVLPDAANKRHIVTSAHMWYKDISEILRKEFYPYGYYVPTIVAPYIVHYLGSFLDGSAKWSLPRYGKMYTYSNVRMKEVLNVEPIETKKTLLDTIHSLIQCGVLHKTPEYKNAEQNFTI